jgi:SSS family transporter
MLLLSFIFCLVLFVIIGALSVFKSQKTTEDYLVANKTVSPWLAGLSAVATNNSGFMFIGMIGLTYTTGLSSIWLMFGWIVGDLMVSLLTLQKIRHVSENIHSFGGLLARWHGQNYIWLRRLTGLLIVIFLGAYAAAQLKAADKATSVLFEWDSTISILIGALIILIYSIAGGIRASIWTDAAQSIVMIIGMFLLVIFGIQAVGGIEPLFEELEKVNHNYMAWFPDKSAFEVVMFILGWLFGGIAVIGQPHIVIRFMAFQNPNHVNRVRFYYYSWFIFFYGATIVVGLLTRILLPETAGFDAELALPIMANSILPDILVGLILAAIFAATMSTADSLVLSCSAAITRDFLPDHLHSLKATKLATAFVVIVATGIALSDNQTVFQLVLLSWALLASAFVPLIIVYSFGQKPSEKLSILMVISGISALLIWRYFGLNTLVYEVMPGILCGLLVFSIAKIVTD